MIEVRFVDIDGRLKGMVYPLEKPHSTLEEVKGDQIFDEGLAIDGSSVQGFTPIEDSDLLLKPLKETIFEIPYTDLPQTKVACMCDIYRHDRIFQGDTRSRLRIVMEKLLGTNRIVKVGPEPEFFILKDKKPIDSGGYGDVYPNAEISGLIKKFSFDLMSIGFKLRVHHHEVSPAQYEIELGYNDALNIADTIINYKGLIRALSAKNGVNATFMPKPFEGMNGNGMHFHLSLWDHQTTKLTNLFSSGEGNEISKIGYHFMAGILDHAKALTALVAPTVNSYKRLVPGFEAPVYIAWAKRNRSALVRIPAFTRPQMARFEYRCPDPSCNIYLALLAIIAAGMDGVKKELSPGEAVQRNIFQMSSIERRDSNIDVLPGDLNQAIYYLKKDSTLKDALGEYIYNKFIDIKIQEWLEYSTQVTDWDWNRYFDI